MRYMKSGEAIWKDVDEYEAYYEVSNAGQIRSKDRKIPYKEDYRVLKGKLLSTRLNNCGYEEVRLSKQGKTLTTFTHILSARAFIPNPLHKTEINHINGIKTDNRVSNLEWATRSENMQHAYKIGLIRKAKPVMNVLTGRLYRSSREAAECLNLKHNTLRGYLNGQVTNKTNLQYTKAA